MKLKYATLKNQGVSSQCSLCSAKFEIWLNNTKLSDERKEIIGQKMLNYCPACKRADEK